MLQTVLLRSARKACRASGLKAWERACREVIRGCLPDDLAPYLPKGWTFGSTDAERDVAKLFRTALTVILKSVRAAAAYC